MKKCFARDSAYSFSVSNYIKLLSSAKSAILSEEAIGSVGHNLFFMNSSCLSLSVLFHKEWHIDSHSTLARLKNTSLLQVSEIDKLGGYNALLQEERTTGLLLIHQGKAVLQLPMYEHRKL